MRIGEDASSKDDNGRLGGHSKQSCSTLKKAVGGSCVTLNRSKHLSWNEPSSAGIDVGNGQLGPHVEQPLRSLQISRLDVISSFHVIRNRIIVILHLQVSPLSSLISPARQQFTRSQSTNTPDPFGAFDKHTRPIWSIRQTHPTHLEHSTNTPDPFGALDKHTRPIWSTRQTHPTHLEHSTNTPDPFGAFDKHTRPIWSIRQTHPTHLEHSTNTPDPFGALDKHTRPIWSIRQTHPTHLEHSTNTPDPFGAFDKHTRPIWGTRQHDQLVVRRCHCEGCDGDNPERSCSPHSESTHDPQLWCRQSTTAFQQMSILLAERRRKDCTSRVLSNNPSFPHLVGTHKF
ncbi:hypothetical protein BLNAU_20262 [Blattamonas nauphoetae]|uniref:Uncharacterized protein n=1 Tax=Blattamonas nauphoetae TaxID=2049346 RepID=A0ABQ9WZ56_9EUKA|nr:hypothetical protein BLNAU_20262 [Blattamonas nauphoetae]